MSLPFRFSPLHNPLHLSLTVPDGDASQWAHTRAVRVHFGNDTPTFKPRNTMKHRYTISLHTGVTQSATSNQSTLVPLSETLEPGRMYTANITVITIRCFLRAFVFNVIRPVASLFLQLDHRSLGLLGMQHFLSTSQTNHQPSSTRAKGTASSVWLLSSRPRHFFLFLNSAVTTTILVLS